MADSSGFRVHRDDSAACAPQCIAVNYGVTSVQFPREICPRIHTHTHTTCIIWIPGASGRDFLAFAVACNTGHVCVSLIDMPSPAAAAASYSDACTSPDTGKP